MASLDIDVLRNRLETYHESLKQHLVAVQDRHEEAESAFQALHQAEAGAGAENYQGQWQPASAWIQEYVATATQLAAMLEERTGELERIR